MSRNTQFIGKERDLKTGCEQSFVMNCRSIKLDQ